MSIKIMNAVWESGPADHTGLLVLLAMADIADDAGRLWPSVARIAEKARMSERNARRIIRLLEADGWLETTVNRGRNNTSSYRINTDKITGQYNRTNCPPGQNEPENRTNDAIKPDIAVSPEPSVTIIEPSEEPPLVPPTVSEKPEPKARLPSNWTLSDEGWAYARSQQIPDEVIHDEARGFHAYWSDRRDRDARKSARGWEQCWAGWCRRIATRYRARGGMAGQTSANGYGQGGSIASIAARRRATGQV